MLEKWADVVGYEGLYLVSESGEIKGVKSVEIAPKKSDTKIIRR